MTVPRGLFTPGGETGLAQGTPRPFAPLEWLLQYPATRRWWAKSERGNVSAGGVIDPAIQLADGFEGVILTMTLLGHSEVQGANAGIGWQLLIDKVPYWQTFWTFGGSIDQQGRVDVLTCTDGMGNSWDDHINIWLQIGALVEVNMNNNGGSVDPMGWSMTGAYWPITARDEWQARGWRK